MNTIIRVENLGKKYILKHRKAAQYTALRDVIMESITLWSKRIFHPSDMATDVRSGAKEEFWALKDISFEVKQGERIGIIGRNGAGKSTLLKILSRITEPTTGEVRIKGRVASLLEVGTGFHPELTGRENIFLNGAILGMSRGEIGKKFDEIVDFAEIEKFLDTPVKRYSSGMYVRLAFAVAAHLEPEILIVDEVLAVGDAQFQKKCLGKMDEVGKEGRTVLFVSHNMQAIRQLCGRAILLQCGRITTDGDTPTVIDHYLRDNAGKVGDTQSIDEIIRKLPPDPAFRLDAVRVTQGGEPITTYAENGRPIELGIHYRVLERTTGLRVYFDLCDDQDTLLFRSFHDEDNDGIPVMNPGIFMSKTTIPADLLGPADYELRIRAGIYNVRSCLPVSGIRIPLNVKQTSRYNRAYSGDKFRGKLGISLDWVTKNYE